MPNFKYIAQLIHELCLYNNNNEQKTY